MTTSVCMGTYNGERFILEQLDTIRRQSRVPDEVIICDDCSTDTTVKIIKEFIEEHELGKSWKLLVNTENKGYPGNFYYAMSLCTKEVVFLADQDDIWDLHKIEEMCIIMTDFSRIKLLACKFNLVDEYSKIIHTIMQPTRSSDTGKLKKISMDQVLYKCEWPGMVMCYENNWYKNRTKMGTIKYDVPHDFFLSILSSEESVFFQIDKNLSSHRRHKNNTGDEEHRIKQLLEKERKYKEILKYIEMIKFMYQNENIINTVTQQKLSMKLSCMEERYNAIKSCNIINVLKVAWKNKKYWRISTLICDIKLCL